MFSVHKKKGGGNEFTKKITQKFKKKKISFSPTPKPPRTLFHLLQVALWPKMQWGLGLEMYKNKNRDQKKKKKKK